MRARNDRWRGLVCAALGVSLAWVALAVAAAQAQAESFGLSSFAVAPGSQQAGAHADLHTEFSFHTNELGGPAGEAKNVQIRLPAGMEGNALQMPRCTPAEFELYSCQPSAQVGVMTVVYKTGSEPSGRVTVPVYNLTPISGHNATFVTSVLFVKILLEANVANDGTYALEVAIHDLSTEIPIVATSLTLWGVPAAPTHDLERSRTELGGPEPRYGPPNAMGEREIIGTEPTAAGVAPVPLLTNSTDCAGPPLTSAIHVESWEGQSAQSISTMPAPSGCELLGIAPTISVAPETTERDVPSGYNINIGYPLNEGPFSLATPALRAVTVTLPAGTSLSPGVAGGLVGCTEAQFQAGECPNAAKIGTVVFTTPLLAQPLEGTLDLSVPTSQAMYRMLLSATGGGITVHLIGIIHPDPVTGQLTVVFAENPQLPFSGLDMHLFGGAEASLANPATCGEARSTADFVSYGGQTASAASSFDVDANGVGGACPSPSPFTPGFVAGTSSTQAGGSSPFIMTVTREDGQQNLGAFTTSLPPGLMGMLAQVPLCGEPATAQGACPQASLVGSIGIAAGAGASPLHLSGSMYLTGPTGGAPFGLSIVVPAIAGPFNLGTIVTRAQIKVAPNDLHLTIVTEPLPQIVSGIPLRVRTVSLSVNRQGFILDPTNCSPLTVAATIESAQGASYPTSSPFRVSGCGELPFTPKLTAATSAQASSRGNGAELDVKLTNVPGVHANLTSFIVEMPKSLKPRLTTVQQACVAATFAANPAACPADSVVGSALVNSPLLSTPLTGPVYLVFHRGTKYPGLDLVLQGGGLELQLDAAVNITKGVSSTAFRLLPDVAMGLFELNLPEGSHSMLGATENLCAKPQSMPYEMVGQSGTRKLGGVRIAVTGCRAHIARKARRAGVKAAARPSRRSGRRRR